MSMVVWLIVGCLIGGVAGVLMRSPGGIPTNVAAGIAGAFIGGWLLGPLAGAGAIDSDDISVGGLAASMLGAVVLPVTLLRRGRRR
jgi:uncharacterized membrane protein YeaQ/YmgE (transglycosylase-associated protein family)